MESIGMDTWAFLEVYYDAARRDDVTKALGQADFAFTVRDVVAETFNWIAKRARRTEDAWIWLDGLAQSRIRIFEPPLAEVRAFLQERRRPGSLSFTDYALALVAERERVREIATEDAEFRKLGLDPLFARR